MRLTRMALDTSKRRTMLALSAPSIFHGVLEQAFPRERMPKLWRIDRLRGTSYLMILSEEEPDLTQATAQLGFDGRPWESKDYSPLLQRITDGSRWNFRLCANPTYSSCRTGERGKVQAQITPEHQMQWLIGQGEKHGFSVTEDSARITESRWYQFGKGGGDRHQVRLLSVTYEGMLTVTDTSVFLDVLQHGIGREKAYGMGLMTLAGIKH